MIDDILEIILYPMKLLIKHEKFQFGLNNVLVFERV